MARVVQQRGTPPYLLILVVVLFLVSTSLAVLFYTRYDEKRTELAAGQEALLKRAQDLSNEKQAKLRLIKLITGREGQDVTDKVAQNEGEQAFQSAHAQAYKTQGLAAAVSGLDAKIGDAKTSGYLREISDLKAQVDELNSQITAKEASAKDLQAKIDQNGQQHQQQMAAARADFQKQLTAKDEQLARAVTEQKAIIADKDRRITVAAQDLQQARDEIRRQGERLQQYLEQIASYKRLRAQPGEAMARKPDGKIIKTMLDQGIVYINLGEKDRITPGLPFTVYSSETGIPPDGKGKAQILVNNVYPNTSECRIVQYDKADPVIEGDEIANIVFDPTRTYSFVVEGEFDLYGERRPDPLGNRRVRSLIEQFGGKVAEDITIDTDFVVLGEAPPRPPALEPDAQPNDRELYKQRMKMYDQWNAVKAAALTLQIPLLDTDRFLAFTGLVLKKGLTE